MQKDFVSQDFSGNGPGAVPQWPGVNVDFSPPGVALYQATAPQFAGWWQRVGAAILDGLCTLLLLIPGLILLAVIWAASPHRTYTSTPSNGEPTSFEGPKPLFFLLVGLIGVVWLFGLFAFYYGHLQGRKGATWGKRVVGIKVVKSDSGLPIGFWRGIGRYFVPQILTQFSLGIFGLLNVLWPLWDKKNQAIHDKMFGSFVVRSK